VGKAMDEMLVISSGVALLHEIIKDGFGHPS
jgi:hypothetical protein